MPLYLPLDNPHPYAVTGEFTGGEQAGGAGAHNQDIILRQQLGILLDLEAVLKA